MTNILRLPEWLRSSFQIALLGEIDSSVRKICVALSEEKELLIRYYIEREPTDDDYEHLEVLQTEISSMVSREQIKTSEGEYIVSTQPLHELDSLQGNIFVRKE